MDARSEEEYTGFFRAEQPSVYRTILLMTRDPDRAREITQDAFTQAFVHWKKVRRYDRPGAWVRRVAIRLATRSSRREAMHASIIRTQAQPDHVDPSHGDPDLIDAVRRLPMKDRALIVLFYFEDLPAAEIAEVLDTSEGAVRIGLHRARSKLSKEFGEGMTDVDR